MEETVKAKEYEEHKKKCGLSFETIINRIDRLDRAVYGDKDNNELGMKEQVKEIHNFFYSSNIILKVLRGGFLLLAFIAGLVIAVIKIWKEIK